MPSRTAERIKAVRLAWEREQRLVSSGKGTRDWTANQQQSILDIGIALDDDGKPFEGQHMKSVAAYPEHAGNPDNIQFLTREEHLAAHDGNWQNPTNWYYDPVSKGKFIFTDKLIPCKIIDLSNPIKCLSQEKVGEETETQHLEDEDNVIDEIEQPNHESHAPITNPNDNCSDSSQKDVEPQISEPIDNGNPELVVVTPQNASSHGFFTQVKKKIGDYFIQAGRYIAENPEKVISGVITVIRLSEAISLGKRNSNNNEYVPVPNNSNSEPNLKHETQIIPGKADNISGIISEGSYPDKRLSPREHDVAAHSQNYHTKEGIKRIEKDSYSRGGKMSK